MPHLTKSRYMAGLQCVRRLWLSVHEPSDWAEPDPGSIQDIGQEIGRRAHLLFPGGVMVDQPPWEHAQAVARTASLLVDPSVPAIFEAAFEHDGVRVRVDVLERLPGRQWGLREVKSSGSVKDHYADDVAVQVHVLRGSGIDLPSAEVIHVDTSYVRGDLGIDWPQFFHRADVMEDACARLEGIEDRLAGQMACLDEPMEPHVEPGGQCGWPVECDHWDRCTAGKPWDWIAYLPRVGEWRMAELKGAGIESISAIPADFPLTESQAIIRDVLVTGRPFVSPELGQMLAGFGPPTLYLDFEAMSPAMPLYAGTRPYQAIVFQWSLHNLTADSILAHEGFLAAGDVDPRREFAEQLIRAIGIGETPIIVYSAYEQTRLTELADTFPDLAPAIESVIARLADLLPLVRAGVYHPDFHFTRSIKMVAPALCPGFTYDDLEEVADGVAASGAFVRLASGHVPPGDETERLRQALLAYCQRDTLAMVEVHRALLTLAANAAAQHSAP